MARRANVLLVSLLVLVVAIASSAKDPAETSTVRLDEDRAVPGTVWYQGFLADVDTGDPINDTVEIIAQLFDSAVDGTGLWGPETHGGIPVVEGWFNIELGSIESPLPDFATPPYYLQLTINGEPLDSRMKLASAPTAIRAGDVDGGGGGGIGGSGDAGYISVFASTTDIGNSALLETSGRLSLGTTTSDAKLRVENAGGLPTAKLVNTSSGVDAPVLHVERTVGGFQEPLLYLRSPGTSGSFNFFEIDVDDGRGDTTLFYIDGYGGLNTLGGIWSETNRTVGIYSETSGAGWLESGAVVGKCTAIDNWDACGVYGDASESDGYGTGGSFWGGNTGVEGRVMSSDAGSVYGVFGQAGAGNSSASTGVYGIANGSGTNYGVYGTADYGTADWAGYFDGDVHSTGAITSAKSGFEIDHPSDPENAYLRHAYVASPEMKTVTDGTALLDAEGRAVIEMPDWFEALNMDARYQLTAIGAAAPNLHIESELSGGEFTIAGGEPGMKVCWLVTGVRRDRAALADPLTVEAEKPFAERGKYVSPAAFGASDDMGIGHREIEDPPRDR